MLIFLSSPYSHVDDNIRIENYERVCEISAKLVSEGHVVISPIAYGHTLLKYREMPSDWEFWKNFCVTLLEKCDKLIVVKMPGWDKSTGVKEEILYAQDRSIPTEFIEPIVGNCNECKTEISVTDHIIHSNTRLYVCPNCGKYSSFLNHHYDR